MFKRLSLLFALVFSSVLHAQPFPVDIEHRFGTATIKSQPKRVVSLSFIGHDFLLALGVQPIALRFWYGDNPYGVWPWAQDALGESKPIVMKGQIDIEKIAAMAPDLIVGQWSGMDENDYALLSQIAPTVASQEGYGDYGMPWQLMTEVLGRATGTTEQAEDWITRLDKRFTMLRENKPTWQGKQTVVASPLEVGAYTREDLRGHFLQNLGFKIPDAVQKLGGSNMFFAKIPQEDLSPIDVDAIIWVVPADDSSYFDNITLRKHMRAYREGREIYADAELSAALSHSSPLSLEYSLDKLVPLLDAALDGDPATPVSSSVAAGITASAQ